MNKSTSIRSTVYVSLFTALIALGAYISIPIGPVPIVMQNFFVLLAGLILGKAKGVTAVTTYLVIGALGLPVFHNGTGGLGILLGPTGGYLIGYIPAVFVTGLISRKNSHSENKDKKASWLLDLTALLAGTLIIYLLGIPWLKTVLGLSWFKSLSVGLFPFLPGDILKIAAAVPVAGLIRPVMEEAYEAS